MKQHGVPANVHQQAGGLRLHVLSPTSPSGSPACTSANGCSSNCVHLPEGLSAATSAMASQMAGTAGSWLRACCSACAAGPDAPCSAQSDKRGRDTHGGPACMAMSMLNSWIMEPPGLCTLARTTGSLAPSAHPPAYRRASPTQAGTHLGSSCSARDSAYSRTDGCKWKGVAEADGKVVTCSQGVARRRD